MEIIENKFSINNAINLMKNSEIKNWTQYLKLMYPVYTNKRQDYSIKHHLKDLEICSTVKWDGNISFKFNDLGADARNIIFHFNFYL